MKYDIHIVKGTGSLQANEVAPDEDYYEEHTIESLYLLLSDLVKPEDGFKKFTMQKLRDLIETKGCRTVVMIQEPGEDFHHVFITPPLVRKGLH